MSRLMKLYAFVAFIFSAPNSSIRNELFFGDTPEELRRKRLREDRENSKFLRNVRPVLGPPDIPLQPIQVLKRLLADPQRDYMSKVCHMRSWQFFLLADKLKDLIESPRACRDRKRKPKKVGPPCKHDHYHRLFFTLEWLNSGAYFRTTESRVGWGKSSLQEDNVHVLKAIIQGLANQVVWPKADQRTALAGLNQGILKGMVGVMDIREHAITRSKLSAKEYISWSTKHHKHAIKNMSVVDHTGRYIYVHCGFGKNDRAYFTSTSLYMQAGLWFSQDQFVITDGGFKGDGPIKYSYNNPGKDIDKQTYNLAFKEARSTIETAYGRVANWFPILGNNKSRLNYNHETTMLTIHAATRLHNWLLNSYDLSYDFNTNPENVFQSFY